MKTARMSRFLIPYCCCDFFCVLCTMGRMMKFTKNIFLQKEGHTGLDSNGFPEIDPEVLGEAKRRVAESSLRDATTSLGAAAESGRVYSTNKEPTFVSGAQINKAEEMIKDPELKNAKIL